MTTYLNIRKPSGEDVTMNLRNASKLMDFQTYFDALGVLTHNGRADAVLRTGERVTLWLEGHNPDLDGMADDHLWDITAEVQIWVPARMSLRGGPSSAQICARISDHLLRQDAPPNSFEMHMVGGATRDAVTALKFLSVTEVKQLGLTGAA